MKRSSDLAQQVLKAQKAIQEWPDSIKSGVRLENSDSFILREDNEKKESLTKTRAKR